MNAEKIVLCVIDQTYQTNFENNVLSEEVSHAFKQEIETEFGMVGERTSVGFGAALPAYLFQVDWKTLTSSGLIFSLIFGGNKIKLSVKGYLGAFDLFKERFLRRNPVLDRNGAACVAIGELFARSGDISKSFRLVGYTRVSPMEDMEGHGDPGRIKTIADAEERVKDWIHVFRFKSGGKFYRIFVNSSRAARFIDEQAENNNAS